MGARLRPINKMLWRPSIEQSPMNLLEISKLSHARYGNTIHSHVHHWLEATCQVNITKMCACHNHGGLQPVLVTIMVRTQFVRRSWHVVYSQAEEGRLETSTKLTTRIWLEPATTQRQLSPLTPRFRKTRQIANCMGYINLMATRSFGLKNLQEQRASCLRYMLGTNENQQAWFTKGVQSENVGINFPWEEWKLVIICGHTKFFFILSTK